VLLLHSGHASQARAAGNEKKFAEQLAQELRPEREAKVPSAHSRQLAFLPAAGPYVPGAQLTQAPVAATAVE